MSETEDTFYKNILNDIQKRENEETKLQNDAVILREKCTEMIANLQLLVNPYKEKTLNEMKEKITKICSTELEEIEIDKETSDEGEEELDCTFDNIKKLIEKAKKIVPIS